MMLAVVSCTFTACGDDSDDTKAAKPSQESHEIAGDMPKVAPDKAIEDFAMIQYYGTTGDDKEASESTGIKPDEIDKFFKQRVETYAKDFEDEYLLNKESATELAIHYLAKCAEYSNLTVKIKDNDTTNPVVTVTLSPVDNDAISQKMRDNVDFVDFMQTIYESKNDPKLAAEMKNNPEFQSIILQGLEEEIFDVIPVKAPKSVDIECEISQGYDGKNYWMPIDPEKLGEVVQ